MVEELHSLNGLTNEEVKISHKKYGANKIKLGKRISPIKIFLNQFGDFMVLILMACTAISFFMGDIVEGVTIISIVIVNAILGFIQEYRTEKTIEALGELSAPTATVIREGNIRKIKAEDVVIGDLIVLEAGDRVPADGVIIEETNLKVDESILSGESKAVTKKVITEKNKENSISSIYMGTLIKNGKCKAFVTHIGMDTKMGEITDLIQNIEEEFTPLQKRLEQLGKVLILICIVICLVVTATGILRGEPVVDMLISGITLAVAAVPEGLPAVVTIALAIGVSRMVKKNALVKKLPSVETLGGANIICSDKTGTITKNIMDVRKIYINGHTVSIDRIDASSIKDVEIALKVGVICNNAKIIDNKILGNATEVALIEAYRKVIGDYRKIRSKYKILKEDPFDSEKKYMSVLCEDNNGNRYIYTKGAVEVILEKCNKILINGQEEILTQHIKSKILTENKRMANDKLRVISIALKKTSSNNVNENNLTFVALMAMIDPPKDGVKEAVLKCRRAGIKTIMITGDNKETAVAIAKEVKILNDGESALDGKELDNLSEEELSKKIENVTVFSRVTPKHKLMIVRALKKRGNIVAMTGDGVNDAPAIKEADIGISMGITGTDVTKETASMILMDDNFSTIVSAVEEGRVIYSNIRKFIRYMLSCNMGEVLTMFFAILIGLPFPLLPIQILWVNLVTDGLPAIALGLEPMEKGIMNKPPKKDIQNIFSDGLLKLIFVRGFLIGLTTLSVFLVILKLTNDIELARTGAFVTLVITQLIYVFECKSETKSLFEVNLLNNLFLIFSVIVSSFMMVAVVYVEKLQLVFKTKSLNISEWCIIIGFSFLAPTIDSIIKQINNRRKANVEQ